MLDVLNPLQIEARYPAYKKAIETVMTPEECAALIKQAREMLMWIERQL
ncbi:MAG: HEPN domain-containing protein [Peptococcaceae bacterium]|nr:HEPN domain-containing protein [Peptococcaceae bacterium]